MLVRLRLIIPLAAAMLGVGGCSSVLTAVGLKPDPPGKPTAQSDAPPATQPVAATAALEVADVAFEAGGPQGPPQAVNVFGEIGGVVLSPVAGTSDAGLQQHTVCEEGYDSDVAVDPTGKWLVFASTRHTEKPRLYTQKVDGQAVVQLTDGNAEDVQPALSPDGKRIAFASTRGGNWDIYVMDADGRNITQITNSPAQDLHPSFAPDGNRLVYCSLGARSDQWELWVVDLSTLEKRTIGAGLFPVWSPDKTVDRIAFQKARQRGSRWFGLWTVDLIDGEPRRLTEVAASSNAALVSPTWNPDGTKLAFCAIADPAKAQGGRPRGQHDLWVVNIDGSGRQRLTDGAASNVSPWWGPTGRIFFVSDRGGKECVWSLKADGPATLMAGEPGKKPAKPANSAVGSTETGEIGR